MKQATKFPTARKAPNLSMSEEKFIRQYADPFKSNYPDIDYTLLSHAGKNGIEKAARSWDGNSDFRMYAALCVRRAIGDVVNKRIEKDAKRAK